MIKPDSVAGGIVHAADLIAFLGMTPPAADQGTSLEEVLRYCATKNDPCQWIRQVCDSILERRKNVSDRSSKRRGAGRALLDFGVLLSLALVVGPTLAANAIDPEADKILRSMTTYLGGLPAFRAKADVDTEIINLEGQKLQLSASTAITVQRPGKLHVRRQGVLADAELIFDGKALTIYGKGHNAYYQVENPGTIDNVVDAVRISIGVDAPAADLMYTDSYPALAAGVTDSDYLGTAYVNGVECHHLAFREARTDWQLWVKTGDEPLPMKYIITTKWVTGAPQHSVRFRAWDTKPQIEAGQFAFSAPEGAKRLETISVDETGEPIFGEVQQ